MPSTSQRPKILLLGDSLTQISFDGWGGGLAHRYQRRADVLNRGMSGYNTRWYLQYGKDSEVWKEPGNVALATIWFGANDASLATENPHHHVPVEEYQNNLKRIIIMTKESYPGAKLILITPPPVHHAQRLEFQKQRFAEKATGILERTLESADKYAEACKTVASHLDVPCLDMFKLMKEDGDGDFGRFLWDGLHFSKEGNDFVLENLLEFVEKEYPSMHVTPDPITGQENNSGSKCDGVPSSGPYHDHIDSDNWKNTFEEHKKRVHLSPSRKRVRTEEPKIE